MPSVLIPLAEGCEEIEAVTMLDILRRAKVEVISAGLKPGIVKCSRGTQLVPDTHLDDAVHDAFDMIALPGGLPGAEHLKNDARIIDMVKRMNEAKRYIAAICAAPMVLHAAGVLEGRRATSFPGVLDKLSGSHTYVNETVVIDGHVVTSRGPGTAMEFALTLVELLCGRKQREVVEGPLQIS